MFENVSRVVCMKHALFAYCIIMNDICYLGFTYSFRKDCFSKLATTKDLHVNVVVLTYGEEIGTDACTVKIWTCAVHAIQVCIP